MGSDASILFAMVLSRVEHKEWPQDLNAQLGSPGLTSVTRLEKAERPS